MFTSFLDLLSSLFTFFFLLSLFLLCSHTNYLLHSSPLLYRCGGDSMVVVLSLGEAIWSPRCYDYTMSIAPEVCPSVRPTVRLSVPLSVCPSLRTLFIHPLIHCACIYACDVLCLSLCVCVCVCVVYVCVCGVCMCVCACV